MAADSDIVIELLAGALDRLGAALVELDGLPDNVFPDNSFDAALAGDEAVRDAHRRLSTMEMGLDMEEAVNAYAGRCAEAAFRL